MEMVGGEAIKLFVIALPNMFSHCLL